MIQVAVTVTQCWHRVPGGTARSVLDLIDAVAATGRASYVGVAPRWGTPTPSYEPTVSVRRALLPLPVLYDSWHRLRWPAIDRVVEPVDLVHVSAPVVPPVRRTPMVATVHDLVPVTHPELLTVRGARLLRRGLELIRDEAAVVMVPSQVVADDCRRFGIDDDRIRVIPWGVSGGVPEPSALERVRHQYSLVGDYVLFVGTVEPRKNLQRLVSAVERLGRSDLTLVVVGPRGWGEVPVETSAKVVFTGHVPSDDLGPLMAGAAAFCFPSLAEGFGLPVLEALASGAAVLTSDGTACAEVAGDAAVLVDPTDVAAIAAGLERVLGDVEFAASLRALGPERAGTFNWSETARATISVYEEVAA
ncbi:MAG: glycosyltransferase family 4 protein [Actinomycetes bacterium]